MFEWFFAPYEGLLSGLGFLLRNPAECSAVDLLRALTALLCAAVIARVGAHWIADRRLRRRCPAYSPEEFSALHVLYRQAGALVGIRALPPLHRYTDERPLAFTTGFFRPAVFLAPSVVDGLGVDELRAVLVHELIHVRRRDNLRAWINGLLPLGATVLVLQASTLYLLFFHVPLRFGFGQAGLLIAVVASLLWGFRSVAWPRVLFRREVSCDDRVVKAVGDPLVVASSLVQVWRLQRASPTRPRSRWLHAHALLSTQPTVQERVRRLIEYRPPRRRPWLAAARKVLSLSVVVWMVLFLMAYHAPDPPAHGPDAAEVFLMQL
jgi:Zn-dependent protease with chaperone function